MTISSLDALAFRTTALALLCSFPVSYSYADCKPAGSNKSDGIVCSATQTTPVSAGAGNDTITISPGASISIEASTSATAVDAGSGNDSVVNDGRVSIALTANPATTPASQSLKSGGCPMPPPKQDVQAVGISGGGGNDHINNRGTVAVQTSVTGGASAGSNCDSASYGGHGMPPAMTATSIGVLGSNGNDQIENSGSISSNASADSAGTPVTAKGIAGGNGNDVITNTGTITVAAASTQKNTQTNPFTSSSQDSVDHTVVNAVGIEGGNGKDDLRNDGTISVDATATVSSVTPTLTLTGGSSVTATTTVETRAIGIDTGTGRASVSNTGEVTANARSEVSGVSVSVTLVDLSRSVTNTTVTSTATGVDASHTSSDAYISNSGTITANATSKSASVGVEVNGADAATADSALVVQSSATGIAGGRGLTTIDTSGAIKASATSRSSDVSVNVSYVDATIADRTISNTSTTLNADAVGIDGTAGTTYLNVGTTGSIDAQASSSARALGVSFSVEGVPQATEGVFKQQTLASAGGIVANSMAAGVVGGSYDDRLSNDGSISAGTNSSAHHDNIGIGMTAVEIVIPTPSISLVGAGTTANAAATGIDGGGGNDWIANSGVLKADATASADAKAFSLNLGLFAFDIPGAPDGIPVKVALVVADAATVASAQSTGIAGGAGNDEIHNSGSVQTHANATGGALGVSASATVEFEEGKDGKGEKLFAFDTVVTRATTEATSTATGIDGGTGRDSIYNGGSVTAGATSNATAVGVALSVAGSIKGPGGIVNITGADTSSTATASATGIRGGDRAGMVGNMGSIDATADANVTSVSASAGVSIAKTGLAVDVALARAQSNATATATGIDGTGSRSEIENSGTINAKSTANADSVAVSLSIAGAIKKGVAGGAAVTDASTSASATAIGIATGAAAESDDKDRHRSYYDDSNGAITNAGAINVEAQAHTLSVSASATVSIAEKGVALGVSLADTSTHATATAKGIEANDDHNDVTNDRSITVKTGASGQAVSVALTVAGTAKGLAAGAALTDASVTAVSNAIGVDGAAGDDGIMNRGTINITSAQSSATAVGVSAAVAVAKEGAALDAALTNTSALANVSATGVNGGTGRDMMSNEGTIIAQNISAHADGVSVSLDVALAKEGLAAGAALAKSDTTARASATGLDGGMDRDDLINRGGITLQGVHVDALAVSASLTISGAKDGAALSAALVDADATASATATGISGGTGDDSLSNSGSIVANDVKANGTAVGVSVSASFAKNGVAIAAALAETGTNATATAKGIDGGDGYDRIDNSGGISLSQVKADATAVSVSVSAAGGLAGLTVAAGLADASGKAFATAIGLDGGTGDDSLSNYGRIETADIGATAHAAGISVGLSGSSIGLSAGAALANTSGTATTTAKGMDGGAGSDSLTNEKDIVLSRTSASADAVSVSLSVTGTISAGVAAGAALTKAGANANATAIGIDGGAGNDYVMSGGNVTVDGVTANATAVGASVQLGVTDAGASIGAALADTHADAKATAKGLAGGDGDDSLWNARNITLQNVNADARGVGVGVTMNGTISGGVAAGVALTDGHSTADATAIGMDGGSGRDNLYNSGAIKIQNVEADAHATGVSVTLNASFAGVAAGGALADTGATARTVVKGMDGGDGDDKVSNMGTIDVQGKAKADALSIAINVSGTLGVAGGLEITRANTIADALVVGIDGGSGRDQIENGGSITATAQAESKAASISVGVSVGIGGDATLSDAKSSATATAVGIDNSDSGVATSSMPHGDADYHDNRNTIDNRGALMVSASATSTGTSVSGNLFGLALGDTTNTATANAVGIRSGEGKDEIYNGAAITATTDANASGLAVRVTLGGKAMGDASTTAAANSTGIQTGGGDDVVSNMATIFATAKTQASTISVSVGLVGVAEGNASTNSRATAIGIDGGAGKDELTNTGTISAAATAITTANGTRVNLFGVANGDVRTAPTATAIGINGGGDDDSIDHRGSVAANALAVSSASSASWQIAGSAGSKAGTIAGAFATGLDGGDGNNSILNRGSLLAAQADAVASADSVSWTLAGVVGDSGTLSANATSTGIATGGGNDYIRSETSVRSVANATLFATGGSEAIFGNASANTQVGAVAIATGIDAGAGKNDVENTGAVTVLSSAVVNSNKTSFSFAGNAAIDGLLAGNSFARGIIAGDGGSTITNGADGAINVSAKSLATGNNGASADLGGSTNAAGSANANATAVGIGAGNGANRVYNDGTISVNASASPTANNDSSAGLFFSEGGVSAIASSNATASGIALGNGDNLVNNTRSIDVTAATSAPVNSHAAGGDVSLFGAFGGNAFATSISTTFGDVAGVRTGNGNQKIYNSGTVTTQLTLSASANTDPNSGDLGGTGVGRSIASAGIVDFNFRDAVKASGIVVGDGASIVANKGGIKVLTNIETSASTDADGTVGGDANGFVFADSAVRAAGVFTGNGGQLVINGMNADITVNAQAKATAGVDTDPGSTDGDSATLGRARTNPTAYGIAAGAGNSRIANDGKLDITATATSIANVRARGGRGGEPTANSQGFAFANAFGVAAGDGNNIITSTGTANVTATATSTVSSSTDRLSCTACGGDNTTLGDAVAQAVAVGLSTGRGNNQIQNDGTLTVQAVALGRLSWDGDGDDNHRVASASAIAIGIDAGTGNNVIINRGTITVTAASLANQNGFGGAGVTTSARAIGIRTGDGNDVVINAGTINSTVSAASNFLALIPERGTAISTGGGDDVVTLKAGSITNGDIDLGSGTNKLILEGTPTVNGSIIDATSTLALAFNGAGSFSGALPGASVVKNGTGTFTLPALPQLNRLEVNQGTLKLDSDYTFMPSGLFQAKVYGDGNNGQFYVNGHAGLAGTMKIVRGPGAYVNGAAFDVLMTRDGVLSGTAFSRVELPDETRLLKFHTEQLADGVRVKADTASFTTVATTPNQMAVAQTLDRVLPTSTGALNHALGGVQALADGQFATAFASLSPAVYANYSAGTFSNMQQYTNLLQERMAALRASDLSPVPSTTASNGEPIRLAYAGSTLSSMLDARDAERTLSSGIWIRGFSQKGDQDAADGPNGFDYRLTGTTIGYDHRFTNSFTGGASLGSVRNKVKADLDLSDGNVDSTLWSLYAGFFDRQSYFTGTLSAGRNNYDTRRNIVVGVTTTPVSSTHDGDVLAASLSAGYYAHLGTWRTDPFVSVQYTKLKENAFSETGSGAGLNVAARTSDGLVSTLGARFSRVIEAGAGSWIPQASLAWLHDFSGDRVVSASYVDAPDASFSINGQPVNRNGALLGLGLSYRTKSGFTSSLTYNGEFRDQFRAHGFVGELRFEF